MVTASSLDAPARPAHIVVPSTDPPPARDSASVVLIRDSAHACDSGSVRVGGIEVFLMRRRRQMAFAGGMTVFPGGGVDPGDSEIDLPWQGPAPRWWAHRLSTDVSTARALVCAAVRELFEECGVLLAADESGRFPDPATLAADRRALVDKSVSLAGMLGSRDLRLRADLLRPMAHWITPVAEPRRYNTRFFLAALPAGQRADGETTEASETGWRTTSDALAEWESRGVLLLPPTWAQLVDLNRYARVADAMAADRVISPIQPEIVGSRDGVSVVFAGDDDYYRRGAAG